MIFLEEISRTNMSFTSQKNRWFLVAHYLAFSIGLIGVMTFLGHSLGHTLSNKFAAKINYNDWAKLVLEPDKPGELFAYLLAVVGIFFFFLIARIHIHFTSMHYSYSSGYKAICHSKWTILLYFFCALLINGAATLWVYNYHTLLVCTLAWSVLVLLPFKEFLYIDKISKVVMIIVLLGIIINLWMFFIPYFKHPLYVSGDFLDLPEQTKMGNVLIDNTTYINQHRLGGLIKYDPRTEIIPLVKNSKNLSMPRHYTDQENEFIKKNIYEFRAQAESGHYFHHHNTILTAIEQYNLGRPHTEITFLYGWLNTILIANAIGWM